ncbi:hypothetical protein HZS_2265 [Henneguya salminicola]|nr:hypothetical protein HZS_2265 [Henneguya salminicola]
MVGFNATKILKRDPQNIIVGRRASHINFWLKLSLMENKSHIPVKKIYFKIREIRNILNLESIQTVRQPQLRHKRNGQPFLRKFWEGEIHGEHHIVVIWATNISLCMMRYNTHTYIDATFRSIPSHFTQCRIIMLFYMNSFFRRNSIGCQNI